MLPPIFTHPAKFPTRLNEPHLTNLVKTYGIFYPKVFLRGKQGRPTWTDLAHWMSFETIDHVYFAFDAFCK